jgi:filamentous hemagglutinin
VAGLYVDNPNGILVASSGNNLNLQGAIISNAGEKGLTVLNAKHDIKLGTVATASNNSYVRDARNYQKNNSTEEVGSRIQTQGDLILNAVNNLSARAANVSSEQGNLTVNAGNNINIEAGSNTQHAESASYSKKKGSFSSKTKTTRNTSDNTDVISSTFSGDKVNINAGKDLNITGSNLVATQDVNLNAGNNITLNTAQATHDETHYSKTKKSGFTASSTSIGYGSSKLTTTNDTQSVTNVGSTP